MPKKIVPNNPNGSPKKNNSDMRKTVARMFDNISDEINKIIRSKALKTEITRYSLEHKAKDGKFNQEIKIGNKTIILTYSYGIDIPSMLWRLKGNNKYDGGCPIKIVGYRKSGKEYEFAVHIINLLGLGK